MLLQNLSLLSLAVGSYAASLQPASADVTTLDHSTSEELLSLHKKLVEIESISDNELEVGTWLASYLKDSGFTVEKQKVAKDRYNLLAYGSKRDTTILLSSHIDTVPPFWPYYYNKTTDIIGGRGSVDAKASVAAQILAVKGLAKDGEAKWLRDDISLLFVVGEETGGEGMKAFSAWEERPQYDIVIFGEPTEGKLVCGHKGILGFEIHATGRAAHSGYPWLGVSANDILAETLSALLELRQHLPWSEKYGNTTMNFGRIQGGVAANVVAETASAKIATRLAAGTPKIVQGLILNATKEVKARAQKQGGDLEFDWSGNGYGPVDIDCDIEGFEKLTVNYGTDVPNLEGDHRRYLYGPGNIFVAHSDHEALKRKELEQAVLDYRRLIIQASKMEPKRKASHTNDEQVEL
ncbi:Zn-dependent exopeptidase [Didymella exigua CBS 183.55]|uniref:Zn-dependent exopeptidase n=1 Tax=Didymella exigua CBS 183.55 TaxID=1150837 RepID=A0A6A5RS44_9PLEO|nr:Zn-dependent exopeptidase [Didymella exigua CBS 183.55]KAF1929884.1 Zn-dependent exopeptidase [Didymella exigua CBS 183.55]